MGGDNKIVGWLKLESGEQIDFQSAEIRIPRGGPPRLSISPLKVSDIENALRAAAAARQFARAILGPDAGGQELELTIRFSGVSTTVDTGGERRLRGHAEIVSRQMAEWLATKPDAKNHDLAIDQRGADQSIDDYLEAAFEPAKLGLTGNENAMWAPGPLACFLRPCWMNLSGYLDDAVAVIAACEPALTGWRVAPLAEFDGVVSLIISPDPLKLPSDGWSVDVTKDFGLIGHADLELPLEIVHEAPGGYEPMVGILRDALTSYDPKATPLRSDGAIASNAPAAPGMINFRDRIAFAEEAIVSIVYGNDAAMVDRVALSIVDAPPRPPAPILPAATLAATVVSWEGGASPLMLSPATDARWRVTTTAPEAEGGALAAIAATPAVFGEGAGGVHLRHRKEDQRLVWLAQGAAPITYGAQTASLTALEDQTTDIAFIGARIEAQGDGSTLTLQPSTARIEAEAVEIVGETQVSGTLDVSEP